MNRRLQLINWVKAQHEGQLVKDTHTPYFQHLLTVANGVAELRPLLFEIGLCHDVLEKTPVTSEILADQLLRFGYEAEEAQQITACVVELTRHFTKANNPLPKNIRKILEDERLLDISGDAQTVKYADYSYNAQWMIAHDRHHAKDYLEQKAVLIGQMTAGDPALRKQVLLEFKALLAKI